MATQTNAKKTVCVIGGSGFLASLLVKLLLDQGYAVNTTVRDPDNHRKISNLVSLQKSGELKIFKADLTEDESFDAPVTGCDFVFLVATPVNFASQDPENDMIKPATRGVLNVLQSCAKAKTVKRVVLTSSAAAVSINKLDGSGLVVNEEDWTDVEFLSTEKPPTWGYAVSKTLAEKAAWKFAEENNIDLIAVIPSLVAGPSLTPDIPTSTLLAMALVTGNEGLISNLKIMQMLSGSISISHVDDVCRAHIFLAEKESARGRYICCAINTSVPELAKYLIQRYPHLTISTDFEDLLPPVAKLALSSEKIIKEGFIFKHGMEEICDQSIEFLKAKGLIMDQDIPIN